jgi:carbamoylphosphate synthase large subunit
MKSFIVTGIGGPAGQNLSSLLLEHNHRVVGTDIRILSPNGVKFYPIPPANSPDFIPALYSIAANENIDMIIPTVSEELMTLANGWEWAGKYPLMISPSEAVRIANDKYLTAQTLTAKGVAVPRFTLPSQVHTSGDVARKIGWPCISKPRVGRGGREVTFHPEHDWPLIANMNDQYILQEFASGTDFAPNVHIGINGKAVVVVLEKTELKEGIIGNAKSVRRIEDPGVAALAVESARAAGIVGPADIDIRLRSDESPVVLEINARFGANIRSAPEVLDAALNAF